MKKLLPLFMLSLLSLSGCVENTSAGRNNATIECLHHDNIVTYNTNSSDYMYIRSDSVIRIHNNGKKILYPAHSCIITEQ